MKKVLVPKVRFKGFSEEWSEERFGELLFRINEKGYEFLETLTASKSGEMLKRKSINYHIQVAKESLKNYNRVLKNDFVLHLSTYESGLAYSKEIGITSPAYDVLRFFDKNNNDPIFFKYVFSNKKFINSLVPFTYGLREGKSINLEELNKSLIEKTNISEQQKIGKLLDHIYNLITHEEIKLNKLKQVKETLLQKMFPEGNSKTPKIRFKGFEGEWKEERFGDTIEPYRIKNYNNEKFQSYSISNKFGFVNQKEFFENGGKAIRANKSNSLVVFPNSFAYNPARIDVGSIGLYKKEENCLVSPIYEVFKTDRKMNDEFLFNWFKIDKFKWIVNKSKEGSVRNTVYLKNISDYLINFPSYSEQQKIGDFFSKISNLISLYQSKLNKLKQIKDALLQKMFI
ncbi:restriction endonuclease subunit S [Mycoplasmopsis felis]|uniref:restriction endonuclease subunit S n=1 Tax=Mycoplasmopsis felis TaxID=33923 RepID=UPI002AF6BD3B|nr:restriction endonuclease subunit S [Mycoplasmopsis felis]WQQ01381.1 restriction endonuclease subunit S [Mycoplasmopsis felis]